jgi:hypothetical protein
MKESVANTSIEGAPPRFTPRRAQTPSAKDVDTWVILSTLSYG